MQNEHSMSSVDVDVPWMLLICDAGTVVYSYAVDRSYAVMFNIGEFARGNTGLSQMMRKVYYITSCVQQSIMGY